MTPSITVSATFFYHRPWYRGGRMVGTLAPARCRYQIVAEVRRVYRAAGQPEHGNRSYVLIGQTWTKRGASRAVDRLRVHGLRVGWWRLV